MATNGLTNKDKKIIGDNVSRVRNKLKLTQTQVGEVLGFESASYISRIETGRKGVNLYSLLTMAKTFDMTVDGLIRGCSLESDCSRRYSRLADIAEGLSDGEFELFVDYGLYLLQLHEKASAYAPIREARPTPRILTPAGVRRYIDNKSIMIDERYVSENITFNQGGTKRRFSEREDYTDDTR
ncbi:MAG: helix-turn-helix transcriptional regulator [Lachnospiraceae bacterium]|nr:helix-turn-helix transcriptional regulator [Lachnospiraceae bacterium]